MFSLLVVPITQAGHALLAGAAVSPDTYVLALPLALDHQALALMAYLGGFSAATGMVIDSPCRPAKRSPMCWVSTM